MNEKEDSKVMSNERKRSDDCEDSSFFVWWFCLVSSFLSN
jgi:hypothetical protein